MPLIQIKPDKAQDALLQKVAKLEGRSKRAQALICAIAGAEAMLKKPAKPAVK